MPKYLIERLLPLTESQARTVLSRCAASLSLYPAWERHDWVMPEPKWNFQRIPAAVMVW
ncbi:hypothetical protein [Deinococcus alpinitundrae]|uniref:hypothetical protein n=1 Tax=Deinococcus alpinitundrae TaxID=468913 RepID=UPI00137A2B2F|nr:hypothetical protein [Deinococcus alpinitundrae]